VTATPKKKAAPRKKVGARRKQQRDETPVFFGRKVKDAREAAGMTQRDFAVLAGIAQPDVPALERGARDVRLTTANRIAKALNIPLRDLLPPR
jgi:DNA-binding XRE family transcriptional regulator